MFQILVLSLIVLSTATPSVESVIKRLQQMSEDEIRATVCEDLKGSGSPIKCAPKDLNDLRKQADSYIQRHGMPEAASLGPVVILPGMGGSALQAKITKGEAPHWWCWQNWDEYFRVWLPLYELLAQDCWFDNLKVDYDPETNEYHNQKGVTTDVIDFGGLSGIDYLDYIFGIPIPFTSYYSSLITSLEAVGYEKGKNLFGAPFDWRLPSTAHELNEQGFNPRFKNLIQGAYNLNNKKVHLVTHSMGGPTALAFLNSMPQAWIDTYIASFVPIAGPWAGSAKALRTTLTGDNFGIEILGLNLLNIEAVSQLAKVAGGLIELVPHPSKYQNQIFVYGPTRNYTAHDLMDLYKDIGSPITAIIHNTTDQVFKSWSPPRTPTHCLYGFGYPTEISFDYRAGLHSQPVIDFSNDGDGTVPLESLSECGTWAKTQSQPVVIKEFNLDHSAILEDQELFDYIIGVVSK